MFASEVEVGASVAVASLVLVEAAVGSGILVLGAVVAVAGAPQAASSNAASTNVVKYKLALFICKIFLSSLLFQLVTISARLSCSFNLTI